MKRETLIIFGLIVITLVAFCGVGHCGFVNYDDPGYVQDNPHVTGGLSAANFTWAWTTFYEGIYAPLTWLSLMLDASLFGKTAQGFHWVNVGFHSANAVLVYLFFRRATDAVWRSALLAAIFAVHPLRVESVVWIVERKDVLSGFFALLAMLAYLRYVRSGERALAPSPSYAGERVGVRGDSYVQRISSAPPLTPTLSPEYGGEGAMTRPFVWMWYLATVLLFTASLFAKQSLTTLPFVLLLLDIWPLGRWASGPGAVRADQPARRSLARLLLEKLPLLAIVVALSPVTIKAQASMHALSDLQTLPMSFRLANAPVAYARYLGKMFWFGNLAVLYPPHRWSTAQVAAACILLAGITVICLWKLRSSPWLIIGWLWFLGVMFPLIGIIQFGAHAMADRFTYFATIGLVLMAVWSIPEFVWRRRKASTNLRTPSPGTPGEGWGQGIPQDNAKDPHANPLPAYRESEPDSRRVLMAAAAGTVLGILIICTMAQTRYWTDSVALFEHDIAVTHSNWRAESNLGTGYFDAGKVRLALVHLAKAVQLNPQSSFTQRNLADAHVALARILFNDRRYEEAAAESRRGIAIDSKSVQGHRVLGRALEKLGRTQEGIDELKAAIAIRPDPDIQRDLQRLQKDLEKSR